MSIVWDEDNDFAGFDSAVWPGALGETEHFERKAAAVIMSGLRKLEEPIFLSPDVAEALRRVDILDYFVDDDGNPMVFRDEGFEVWLYAGPM